VVIGYADAKGNLKATTVSSAVTNEDGLEKIDTVYVGDFTFPVAYAGTGDDIYPYIRIRSNYKSDVAENRDDNLRIDCIILRPKDLDDYLKEHKDYKYDCDR